VKPTAFAFNEKPTYINAIATNTVAANNLEVRYSDSNCERKIITTAVMMPEIVSIILFYLLIGKKVHLHHKDVSIQNETMDNKMSETDKLGS
jgi:hypothetical protein